MAVNNAIVMIDYTNQLRRGGMEKKEAILQGSVTRLRPVLLTALDDHSRRSPMAIDHGQGSEMRGPLGVTLLGGLVSTTFLTLFVIPVVYSLFEKVRFREKKTKA